MFNCLAEVNSLSNSGLSCSSRAENSTRKFPALTRICFPATLSKYPSLTSAVYAFDTVIGLTRKLAAKYRTEGIIYPGINLPARHILLIPVVICKCTGIPLSKITKLSTNTHHPFDLFINTGSRPREARARDAQACVSTIIIITLFYFWVTIKIVLSTCKIKALANAKLLDTVRA